MCGITAYGTCDGNVPAASVVLMMSSAVMLSTEMVAAALVSTEWVEVVAENELPALSVPVTVASKDVSAARSEPATSMEKLLLESTVPE